MDNHGFSKIKDAIEEASAVYKNDRANKYELVALFARIWLLKADILWKKGGSSSKKSVDVFIKGLYEGSGFLLRSLSVSPTQDQILRLVEDVPRRVSECVLEGKSVRKLVGKFLVQAMLFKAEAMLLMFLENEPNLEDQIGVLREGIIFLIRSDINHANDHEEDIVGEKERMWVDFEHLAARVIWLCNSSGDEAERIEGDRLKSHLSDLLEKFRSLKFDLKALYMKAPNSKVPKTGGLVDVTHISQKLQELLTSKRERLTCVAYQIKHLCIDLDFMMKDYKRVFDEDKCVAITAQLVEAAFQVEDVVHSMLHQTDVESHYLMWLDQQVEVIARCRTELIDFCNANTEDDEEEESTIGYQPSGLPSRSNEPLVGYKEEKKLIINRLVRGSKSLKVVAISGMRGIGKTSLALALFNDRSTVGRFQQRLWCTVSQGFRKRKRQVLLDLLHQISEDWDGIDSMVTWDLQEMLRRSLKGQKYLIVMDDVWSSEPWDILKFSFPNDGTGSRILVTSCLYDIIWGSDAQPLRGPSDEECWELLKMKLFHENAHHSHPMDEILGQIAKSCKGLPSAILVVANILSKRAENEWIKFTYSETSGIVDDLLEKYRPTYELSYRYLRNPLKQCFLYFGVCPRGQDISVRKLLWLWIAEGFIENVESKSSEEVARDYLKELIDWNLVTVVKRRSDGKVKTCKVHDQLLDFCLLKAKEANFVQLVSGEPSYGSLDAASSYIYSEFRVSVFGDPQEFIVSKPYGPHVRSLLLFSTNEMYPGCDSDASFISSKMKLVKVVDLESVNVGTTLENGGTDLPQNLRYLALGGDMISIPSSLPKLQYLETLIVKGLMNKLILPSTIWCMKSLRHLQVSNHCIFTLKICENSGSLDTLVSLSMPSFSYGDQETDDILKRLPNLRKLKCVLLEPCVGSMQTSHEFPKFGYLLQYLESLKLSYSGWPLSTVEWNFPYGLTQLTLSNFRLPWGQISSLSEAVPNLEVLKLISGAFEGETWEMSEGEFQKLRYLKLDSLNIVHWFVDDDKLPALKHLVLRNCKRLEKVPSCFGRTATLQKIEVHQCGVSAQESVQEIIKEQVEFSNEELISSIS